MVIRPSHRAVRAVHPQPEPLVPARPALPAAPATFEAGAASPPSTASGAGRIDPASAEGQQALAASLQYLCALGGQGLLGAEPEFQVQAMERDELGMTHVRLDRMHEGLKVFPEQVITHLNRAGKVRDATGGLPEIPAGLASSATALDAAAAKTKALAELGEAPQGEPSVEKVITRGRDGEYRLAYHVQATNLASATGPKRMSYVVDASTGEVLNRWNQIAGIDQEQLERSRARQARRAEAKADDAQPAQGRETHASAAPKQRIADFLQERATLKLDEDFKIGQLTLDLDISHSSVGDLVVTLTSPSGTTHTLFNRERSGEENIKGTFDLTKYFKGEPTKGTWTLAIQDMWFGGTGTLNSWKLDAKADAAQPKPPRPPGPHAADDTSIYSGTVDIGATQESDGRYVLVDESRGKGVETQDGKNLAPSPWTTTDEIHDDNDTWGEASDPRRNAAAVDAQYGASMTYDYYKDILGRNSIDDDGERLVNVVHVDQSLVNAFWDGNQMNYGDGDRRNAAVLTTLDVAGHEITHGLTQRTANLIYSGESGGLNEAFSDILGGVGVEWYALKKNPGLRGKVDIYSVGEQCWTPGTSGDALRYMDDPTKDGYSIDNYKDYESSDQEVHRTSGIATNAFYLLTHGGKNKTSGIEVKAPIAMEKALKIFGRALTAYMTRTTTFSEAREATLKAATDLYGEDSKELAKVKEAWSAVGVE